MSMSRLTCVIGAAIAAGTAASGWAAQLPKSLTGVAGGQWELSGIPGSKAPVKQCVASPVELAFVEHKAPACTHLVLGDSGDLLRLSYRCVGGGFGQATIKTLTPRSLRVDVQGIAGGAPYAYVMQAHRVGDCPAAATPAHR
jgi:hypothetical protein